MSHDALGHLGQSNQQTAGQTYPFSYTWNLADAVTADTYPSGRVVNTSYNELNQASAVSGTWASIGTTYVSQVHYWPHGGLYWYVMGNSIERVFNYNSRLQAACRWDAFQNSPAYYLFQECPIKVPL